MDDMGGFHPIRVFKLHSALLPKLIRDPFSLVVQEWALYLQTL